MYSSNVDVAKIQHEVILMLTEIDRICQKNNIHYSLHGGSLLGAVREHGFIPWDDDGDISMTREEFSKFARVFNKQCGGYHMVCDDKWVIRIRPRKSSNIDKEACVDLFIYDYISSSQIAQKLKIFTLRMLQGMLKEDIDYSKYNGLNKFLIIGTHILGLPFSRRAKLVLYRWVSIKAFAGDKKRLQRTDDRANINGINIILPNNVMDSYHYCDFENTKLMITDDFDYILKTSYGENYMTPNSNWSYD